MTKLQKQIKTTILPVLQKYGVLKSDLFGSFVNGSPRPDSDVDILVKLPSHSTLFDLVDLQMELTKTLKRQVDLVTYDSVSPSLKNYIFQQVQPIIWRRTLKYIGHIVDCVTKVEKYLKSVSLADFQKDEQIQDAVIRRFEIIGEAVKNLPAVFKKEHKDIPWKKMAGMRNFLIHEYFGVDVKLVYKTAKINLPELKIELLKIKFKKPGLKI